MKHLYLSILFLLLSAMGYGQADSTKKRSFFKLSSFGLRIGGGSTTEQEIYQAHFSHMAPANSLASFDTTGYIRSDPSSEGIFDMGLSFGFTPYFKNKKKYGERLSFKVSLSYQNQANYIAEYSKEDTITTTTYSSQTTGVTYIVADSTDLNEYRSTYGTMNVLAEISCNYNLVNKSKFKVYTGLCAGIGLSFNNYILVQYNNGYDNSYRFIEYGFKRRFHYDKKEETKLPSDVLYSLSVPIGLTSKFFRAKHVTVNPEIRVGDRIERFPNYKYNHKAYFIFNIGLKYTF